MSWYILGPLIVSLTISYFTFMGMCYAILKHRWGKPTRGDDIIGYGICSLLAIIFVPALIGAIIMEQILKSLNNKEI